ncbi:MAG: hypothetical protein SF051_09295 [Elusimicrobiota bacterium]|nr:hypothetical protein [Elusimicrobiota bacterium]
MTAVLAALLLLAAPASAGTPPMCKEAANTRPRIVVRVGEFPTAVDHSRGIAEIDKAYPVKKPKGLLSQGLTVAEYRLHYSADMEGACDKGCKAACAWVGAFTVDLTPVAVRILIPREYAPGSCEYEQLTKHEGEHDKLHRRRLDDLAKRMREALARVETQPGLVGPIEARDRQAAFDLLTDRMERVMRPIYDAHLAAVREENAALDSAAEYKRLGRACKNWLKKRH